MNRPFLKTLIVTTIIAVILTAGCGPQSTGLIAEEPPSVKKCRTIAAENIELKKQLEQSSKEF